MKFFLDWYTLIPVALVPFFVWIFVHWSSTRSWTLESERGKRCLEQVALNTKHERRVITQKLSVALQTSLSTFRQSMHRSPDFILFIHLVLLHANNSNPIFLHSGTIFPSLRRYTSKQTPLAAYTWVIKSCNWNWSRAIIAERMGITTKRQNPKE